MVTLVYEAERTNVTETIVLESEKKIEPETKM